MLWPILTLYLFGAPTFAQSNGLDPTTDVPIDLAVGSMIPYAHFTPGDTVWFSGWVPSSVGTMVGACIGLFLLAVLERVLATCLELAEQHWISILVLENMPTTLSASPSPPSSLPGYGKIKRHRLPPFVRSFDITRGVMFAAHSAVRILLMLAVMTFQMAFLLSIAIGSGVGEMLFGRFVSSYYHEH